VIVTVPVEVLKRNIIEFQPRLPSWKTDSIAKIGISYFDKLILEFDEPFWEQDIDYIFILSEERGLWNLAFSYWKSMKKPILAMLNCGDTVRKVAGWSDEKVLESGLSCLKNIYPGYREPIRHHRTNWSENPFSM
jgi:polyamine oxidase